MTVPEATALAAWVGLHDRRLTTIYITHGHGDHYLGLPVVLDRFPDARPVATTGTVRQMQQQAGAGALDDSLRARFPGQIAGAVPLPEPLDAPELPLKGLPLDVIEPPPPPTPPTTTPHFP